MLPKVEGPWDIHTDQLLAQLDAQARPLPKPILIHAILETAEGREERRGDRRRQSGACTA
jgi:malyl-CoA/(S)-citramalyl-CoA lyase